jgi:hypothetical protein
VTASISTGKDRRHHRTGLEMLAVVLLGVGSVATAWCGIQVSRWNGEETSQARDAGIVRTDASASFGLGTQKLTYDAGMTTQYAQAVVENDTKMQEFLRNSMMRPAFLPTLDRWQAAVQAGDTSVNLFTDQEYLDSLFAESTKLSAESDAALARSDDASENGDAYLLTTLLTATALFFAGVTTSFASKSARLVLVSMAAIVLVASAVRLVDLPVI